MTKSTKIIAALGVAAGLGIAALPAGAIFATTSISPWPMEYTSTSGDPKDVTVELNVSESLALGVSTNTCTGDSDDTASGIQNFTIKDTGACTMEVAGGTNGANGFKVSVATKTGYSDNLRLGATYPTTFTETDQNTVKGNDGVTISGAADATAGWNMTGGLLTKKKVTSTAQVVMATESAHQYAIPVTYDFGTRSDQEAGHYSTMITYTIAANPAVGETGHVDAGGTSAATDEYPASV